MKQFISNFFLFILIFIIFTFIVIFINYKILNDSGCWKFSEKTNYIVLGHSHSASAFNDSLISNFSNFSSSGEAYFYTYLKAKKIIPNNKQIRVVFIEFDNTSIDKRMDSWTWGDEYIHSQFPFYFPLLKFSEFEFLWEKNSKAILKCAPQSFIKSMGYNYLSILNIDKSIEIKNKFGGYWYLVRDKTDSLINCRSTNFTDKKTNSDISETNIKYLTKIIELCKKNEVKVFLIRSPILYKYTGLENEQKLGKLLSTQFSDYEFLDFKDFPLLNSEFGDLSHLNFKGAKKFSSFFNNLLESGLLNNENKQHFINESVSRYFDNQNAKNDIGANYLSKNY